MALKFYTSVAKVLKVKVKKLLRLIPMLVEVTREKLVGGFFAPPPFLPTLNRVKEATVKNDLSKKKKCNIK